MSKKSVLAEHHEEVVAMIKAGATATQVGVHYGTTRNSVLGYCHRRGIKVGVRTAEQIQAAELRRGKQLAQARKGPDRPVPARKPPVPLPEPLPVTAFPVPLDGVGVPFLDMERAQCRRPLWGLEDRIGNVCGRPVKDWPEQVYCRGCLGQLLSEHGRLQFRRNLRRSYACG